MSVAHSLLLYTVEQYLALERESDERQEYLDGQIYAMAGESPEHGTICTNLTMLLASQLRGGPCQAWSKDMKVRSGPTPSARPTRGLYSYPDLVVVCGEPEFHDDYRDVLLNPKVIIEVLSPSTEAYDRGQKFHRYRTWLPSLTDYLMFAQREPMADHFVRHENGLWVITEPVNELAGRVEIPSIGCALQLSDVYDRIVFPSVAEQDE